MSHTPCTAGRARPARPGPRQLRAAAVGVGDFATRLFQENWSSDIHNYGVVNGVLYGIGDAEVETGKDFANLGKDIGHTVAHVWDSIF